MVYLNNRASLFCQLSGNAIGEMARHLPEDGVQILHAAEAEGRRGIFSQPPVLVAFGSN